ncbi:MAG: transposase [Candidatus Binatia bacterium]
MTAIQRSGSALNTNAHFHTLVAEGVFATAPDGSARFVPSPRPPTDREVARLLATARRRILRLVRRHGMALDGAEADAGIADGLALAEPALAAIADASVVGRVATGPRAGTRRCGSAPMPPPRWSSAADRATPAAKGSTCTPTPPCARETGAASNGSAGTSCAAGGRRKRWI